MRAAALGAIMERRLLVNYRVDADVLAAVLPAPFRPALVGGHGLGGICLLRLGRIRPAGLPALVGLTSENAAHRVAACWDGVDGPVTGVYVPRRDTSSRLAAIAGGRVFPGWQHLARFQVEESDGRYRVRVDSRDGMVQIEVSAHVADGVMPASVFPDLEAASLFFRRAPVGYAATPTEGVFDGVKLGTADDWGIRPLHIDRAFSSFFDDPARFPAGRATVDSAFLMEGLATTWEPQRKLRTTALVGQQVT
jgi:Uncharacterized conserved protein (COG2071)